MEQITIGQIGLAVTFLVGLITGVGYLHKHLTDLLKKSLRDQFDPITRKIDELQTKIDTVDMESCKNYLVDFLADLDRGQEIDEIERERFWEQYEHYTKKGGNSYIHRKVEQLKSEGKL